MTLNEDYPQSRHTIVPIPLSREVSEMVIERGLKDAHLTKTASLDNNVSEYLLKLKEEKIHKFQSTFSPTKSLSLCGLVPLPNRSARLCASVYPDGSVHTGFSGLVRCKNTLCVKCNKELSFTRRRIVEDRLLFSKNKGHSINFGTLTLPRDIGLENSIKLLNSSYKAIIGNGLRQYCKRRGTTEYIHTKSFDLTICDTHKDPYHLHIHFLVITDNLVDGLKNYVWRRYKSFMKKRKVKVSKIAFDLKEIDNLNGIQNYLNKNLSFELTSSKKIGKRSNSYGFMEWLSRIVSSPSKRQIAIYRDLVKLTQGMRWWTKSTNFEVKREDNELKKEQPIEVFSQAIGTNCWIAINEISEIKVKINLLLKQKIQNPKGDNSIFDEVVKVLKKSNYEILYSPKMVDYYKDKLSKILGLKRIKDKQIE